MLKSTPVYDNAQCPLVGFIMRFLGSSFRRPLRPPLITANTILVINIGKEVAFDFNYFLAKVSD